MQVTGLLEAKQLIRRLGKKLPEAVVKATNEWGGSGTTGLETKMKRRLRQVSERWRGEIYNSIVWHPVGPRGGAGGLNISYHGLQLSRMRPHWVSLKRGRRITQWAQFHGMNPKKYSNAQGNEVAFKSIYVKPHEFVDSTIQQNIPLLQKKLKLFVARTMRNRGR